MTINERAEGLRTQGWVVVPGDKKRQRIVHLYNWGQRWLLSLMLNHLRVYATVQLCKLRSCRFEFKCRWPKAEEPS